MAKEEWPFIPKKLKSFQSIGSFDIRMFTRVLRIKPCGNQWKLKTDSHWHVFVRVTNNKGVWESNFNHPYERYLVDVNVKLYGTWLENFLNIRSFTKQCVASFDRVKADATGVKCNFSIKHSALSDWRNDNINFLE